MTRSYGVVVSVLVLAWSMSVPAQPGSDPPQEPEPGSSNERPNVLVILADDLGFGDVGFTAQAADIRTPTIDSIADRGMVLHNFYANSTVCSPTRASILTGRYPALVGVPGTVARDPETNMGHFAPTGPTLPELLGSAGYLTALIGKWHLGDHLGADPVNLPTRRGFQHFHGLLSAGGDYYSRAGDRYGWPGTNHLMLNESVLSNTPTASVHTTDLVTQWATDYVDAIAGSTQPVLLFLAYTAPHDPIQPVARYVDAVVRRVPGITPARAGLVALIEHLDDSIAAVLDALERTGRLDNTLIIFTSDNGGYLRHAANNGPYRGGKLDLYEGGIRVPAAIAWAGSITPGTSTRAVAVTMDLYATVAEAAGIEFEHAVEGISLLPLLRGQRTTMEPRHLVFENRSTMPDSRWLTHHAVRSQDWKLVQSRPGGPFELFDLGSDPYERTDIAAANRMIVERLSDVLADYRAQAAHVPWQPPLQFERGVADPVTDAWRTITLTRKYRAPVVIATPNYGPAAPPTSVRIRNITDLHADSASFDLRLQRLDGLTDPVPPAKVSYLVIEAGIYELAHHGVKLEALRFNAPVTDHFESWRGMPRKYVNTYAQPVVLGQVLSSADTRFSSFWSRGSSRVRPPNAGTLYVGKHVGEDPVRTRRREVLGYVVTETGAGSLNGQAFIAGVSPAVVAGVGDSPPYFVPVEGLETVSGGHLTQMGMRGADGSSALLFGEDPITVDGFNAAVDEDQLRDAERSHSAERLGYLIFR